MDNKLFFFKIVKLQNLQKATTLAALQYVLPFPPVLPYVTRTSTLISFLFYFPAYLSCAAFFSNTLVLPPPVKFLSCTSISRTYLPSYASCMCMYTLQNLCIFLSHHSTPPSRTSFSVL